MSKNHPHDNIYSILGKLEALKPTPEEKRFALVKEIQESVEAQGSILTGVDAVQAKLAEAFAESKIEEKAVSQAQQKFMGMVHAAQKGAKPASPEVAKVAKDMKKKDAKDFASTKHKGLPQHVAEETCNECGLTFEGCECDHDMNEGIVDSIKLAFGKTMAWVVDTAAKFVNNPELNDKMAQAKVDLANKAEQQMLGLIAGHPREEQLKQQVNYIVTQLKQQQTMQDLITVAQKLGAEFKAERSKFSEGEITRKPGVTTHRKTDFPGYPVDEPEDIDDENKGKRGRPRKHAKKEPSGLGRGRPKKDKPLGHNAPKMHDVFGRVKPGAEKKSSVKGRVHSMMESVNFKRMMEETHMTLEEMVSAMQEDMLKFKETGVCSDRLRDMMEVYSHAKRQMEETQGGIGQDLVTPQQRVAQATPPKPGVMGAVKDVVQGAKNWIQGKPEQGPTYEEVDPLEEELNELAKLAGLKMADEGAGVMHFKKQQAEKAGKDSFKLGDKEYQVKEADAPVDEPMEDELENAPKPKYGTIKNITSQGDDLNRQKRQDPHTANRAANPLTNSPIKLEAKLAAEYESIKKSSN